MLVQDFLESSARQFPEKTALVCGDRRLTYRDIDGHSDRLAQALLGRGVEPGDRVVIQMQNSVEAVLSIFAVLKAGAVFVVVNPTTRQVLLGERQVLLSSREWVILEALIARPGAILSREKLEDRLYGLCGEVESNAVEVYIHGIRKKLGAPFITNIRGVGYLVEKT